MNLFSSFGFLLVATILWTQVFSPAQNPWLYLNSHALLLVIGGTIAAAFISLPYKKIKQLYQFMVHGFLLKKFDKSVDICKEIIQVSIDLQKSEFKSLNLRRSIHPFLQEAYQLLSDGRLDQNQFKKALENRSIFFRDSYHEDAKMLNNLAKYPPAFGLIGTSTSMITMMASLAGDAQKSVGPSMAVALVATFWGISISNFILLPLADYALKLAASDVRTRRLILEGVIQIRMKTPPLVLIELINGHLSVDERLSFKSKIRNECELMEPKSA